MCTARGNIGRLAGGGVLPQTLVHAHASRKSIWTTGLEPLAEVEGALLVVEVLHLPHPKLLGLLGGREHFCGIRGRRESMGRSRTRTQGRSLTNNRTSAGTQTYKQRDKQILQPSTAHAPSHPLRMPPSIPRCTISSFTCASAHLARRQFLS